MTTETPESTEGQRQAEPEFTTRPRRLLMIGRMRPGQEPAVLEAQLHYPIEVAARAHIDSVEGFVGSGYYALLLEIDGDDAQEALTAYLNDPAIRAFHASLRPYVEGLPEPDWQYVASDPIRGYASTGQQAQAPDSPAYSSAQLSLAASMFHWGRRRTEDG